MASVEPSDTIDVTAGANPDSVVPTVRNFRLAPLRSRQGTVAPDYTDNGEDVFLLGDSEDPTDPVTILNGIPDTQRNGLKRAYTEAGTPSLFAEPAPLSYDSAGTSEGTLGVVIGPAAAAANVVNLGVAASHNVAVAADGIPLVVRPVILVIGARFETNLANFQAVIGTEVDGGGVTDVTRDLFYAYGGSTSIVLPQAVVGQGGSLDVEVDLQLTYRAEVTDPFEIEVAGVQVIFQIWEYTSTEVSP